MTNIGKKYGKKGKMDRSHQSPGMKKPELGLGE
jgi:hypothetical protein